MNETKLVTDFLAGDLEAFDEIVQRYSAPVYRLARKFTRNGDDAEDIAQETFLRAYENLLKYPKDVLLKPWLMTICVNLCRNLAKKKKNFNFSDLEREDEEESDLSQRVPDEAIGPHEKTKKRAEKEAVEEALKKIPEKYKIILELRYMEDLSYQEICDILNLPMNTVKVHLNRAKSKLETHLKDYL